MTGDLKSNRDLTSLLIRTAFKNSVLTNCDVVRSFSRTGITNWTFFSHLSSSLGTSRGWPWFWVESSEEWTGFEYRLNGYTGWMHDDMMDLWLFSFSLHMTYSLPSYYFPASCAQLYMGFRYWTLVTLQQRDGALGCKVGVTCSQCCSWEAQEPVCKSEAWSSLCLFVCTLCPIMGWILEGLLCIHVHFSYTYIKCSNHMCVFFPYFKIRI